MSRPHTGDPMWIPSRENITLRLAQEYQLTPYVSPSLVAAAVAHTKMLSSGRIFTRNFQTPKRDVVIIDDDAILVTEGKFRDVVEKTTKLWPSVEFHVATKLRRSRLVQLMKDAKVVYDDCMVGSERVVLEASLFGAVVVTNDCNVGSRFADVPIPSRVSGSLNASTGDYGEYLVGVIVDVLRNYEDRLADQAAARLYFSKLGAMSLQEESVMFLNKLDEETT